VDNHTIFIAHRGFRIGVVENTLTGFHKAVELEMDYIELDIHRSKDKVLYVLHGSDIYRTMAERGTIEEMLSEDLDQVVSHTRNDILPRLSTVFEEIFTPENELTKLMIDLEGEDTADLVCELIKNKNLDGKIIFSGGNLEELTKAHKILPHIPICLNITECKQFTLQNFYEIKEKDEFPLPFQMISLIATLPFHMISLKGSDIPEIKFVEVCHKWEIQALSWNFMVHTVASFLRMTELIKIGIDGFLFDDARSVVVMRQNVTIE